MASSKLERVIEQLRAFRLADTPPKKLGTKDDSSAVCTPKGSDSAALGAKSEVVDLVSPKKKSPSQRVGEVLQKAKQSRLHDGPTAKTEGKSNDTKNPYVLPPHVACFETFFPIHESYKCYVICKILYDKKHG